MNSLRGCMSNKQLAQHFIQRLQSAKLHTSCALKSSAASVSENEPEIVVPYRKERSPTDILMALERTISRDPTAPHYKYHDDPYLTPMSSRSKRSFALSKEAGRKAAMWIHSEFSELFKEKIADPEIKQFLPKAKYEKEDVSEKLLMDIIKEGSVNDALTIYELLEENTSVACKQALLELLCFYNGQEQLPEEFVEERWYRKVSDRNKSIWKENPTIEKLFSFLKEQGESAAAAAYNTMICGTAKYFKVDTARALFEECQEKKIPLNIESYNSIIGLVYAVKDGPLERKYMLLDYLEKICEAGVKPNVKTLNAALQVVSKIIDPTLAKDMTRSLFLTFKQIGVKPCLTSYYFAFIIFCKDYGGLKSSVLIEVMNELEGKTLTIEDTWDTYFFVTAMNLANNHLNNHKVAERVHALLLTGENYRLIGDSFKESIYYRHYMSLLVAKLPFDEFMKFYDLMVPHVYIPEPSIIEEILLTMEQVDTSVVQPLLPRFWTDLVMFEQLNRERNVAIILSMMRNKCQPPEDSPLNKNFAEAAWSYWNFVKEQSEKLLGHNPFNGVLLGDIAVLLLRGNEYNNFLVVLDTMVKDQNSMVGVITVDHLNFIFDECMRRGDSMALMLLLQYAVEAGFAEAITIAQKIKANISLSPDQEMRLTDMMGSDVLALQSTIT